MLQASSGGRSPVLKGPMASNRLCKWVVSEARAVGHTACTLPVPRGLEQGLLKRSSGAR